MTALRAAAPISTSVQRKLTAAWSLLFWRPPGRGRSQLAAFVDDVDGTGGPPSRGADIGADHRHHERRYRDSTQQQRQSGVTVQQRCRTEASDEDGRHDRVPRLTTAQLLRTALRRSRYQRRPIRVTVTHHGPSSTATTVARICARRPSAPPAHCASQMRGLSSPPTHCEGTFAGNGHCTCERDRACDRLEVASPCDRNRAS